MVRSLQTTTGTPDHKAQTHTIGNVDPVCPYCNFRFDKMPLREKKCPNCKNTIYNRYRPVDSKNVLVTEEQLQQLEAQWKPPKDKGKISPAPGNSSPVIVMEEWRKDLIILGGSHLYTKDGDGIVRNIFHPWLKEASLQDRERVADCIASCIKTGKPLDASSDILKKNPVLHAVDVGLLNAVAFQKTRVLHTKSTLERLRKNGVKQAVWITPDKEGNQHRELDGKVFDLDNKIWDELNLPGCTCRCEPVTDDNTVPGNEKP